MLSTHRSVFEEMREVDEKQRYLVTSHDAFNYFTRAYLSEDRDVEGRCMAPEGLAPDGQLSAQDIQRVVSHLSRHRIKVIFPESNVSRDALHKIISSCKHPVHVSDQALYGDSMGDPGSGADTYLGMIQHNAKVLKEQWKAQLKSNR
jgi:manganese/zinc/iron transport system substrate-binding protein